MKKNYYPWLVMVCCCGLSTAAIGLSINCMGVFYSPIAESMHTGIGDVSMFLTILNITSGLIGPYIVKLLGRSKLRTMMLTGVSIASLCYVAMGLSKAIWQIYVLALILGVCNSMFGLVVISLIIGNWFHKMMGIAQGIALSFSGLIGAIMSPVFSKLIGVIGWRNSYFCIAVLVFLAVIPAVIFIRLKPEELGLLPYGMEKVVAENIEKKTETTPKQPARIFTPVFPLLCAITFIGAFVTGIGSHMAGFGTNIGLTAQSSSYLISMVMIGNTSSKMLAGALCDAIGPQRTCLLTLSLIAGGLLLLWLVPASAVVVLMFGALLVGTSYSITGVILSTMTKEICGGESFGTVFSYTTIVGFISSAISYAAIGYSFDIFRSYLPAIIGCVVLVIIALGCTAAAYEVKNVR